MKRLALFFFLLAGCDGTLWTPPGRPDIRSIGPAGGKVVSRDGRFSLQIPRGALDHEVTIEVTPQPSPDPHVIGSLYAVAPVGLNLKVGGILHLATDSMPVYASRPSLGKVLPDGSWKQIAGASWDDQKGSIVDEQIVTLEVFAAWVYCDHDIDCHGGTVCLNSDDSLVPSKDQNTCGRECTDSAGCPAGQVCSDARCITPCVPECSAEGDCGPGMTCDPAAGGCGACVQKTTCTDADGDGYYAEPGCKTEVDCDDHNAAVHPGATEICNNVDDDCNGTVDDGNADAACPPGETCWAGGMCS